MPKRKHPSQGPENPQSKRNQPKRKCNEQKPSQDCKEQKSSQDCKGQGNTSCKDEVRNGNAAVEPSEFEQLKVLGQGAFGKVFLVRKLAGVDAGTLYAMKVLKKDYICSTKTQYLAKMERDILVDVEHPFIVKLFYAFQTRAKLYLILSYKSGGDLHSYLREKRKLPEKDVQFYMAELILALSHLHTLRIIYRDVKPENVLLDADGHVALTDFGLSLWFSKIKETKNKKAYSICGTKGFVAPEVKKKAGYSYEADWWSLGVLFYKLLTGVLPFHHSNNKRTMRQILKSRKDAVNISSEGQNLLRGLCKRNPATRLGAGANGMADLKAHAFFATIDFDGVLAKKIKPPFQPSDGAFTVKEIGEKLASSDPDATIAKSVGFKGYSFIEPSLLENNSADRREDNKL